MVDIATNEPLSETAGNTWRWTREFEDYPASTWTLTYYFRNASDNFDIVATASGDTHSVTVAKATTAAYAAGVYHWRAFVDDGTSRFEVDSGTLTVNPDPTVASALDMRAHAEKVLDAIEAVIENRASKDQESYSIEGRSLSRTPIADLIKLRNKYRAEVANLRRAERIANGLGHRGRVLVRF